MLDHLDGDQPVLTVIVETASSDHRGRGGAVGDGVNRQHHPGASGSRSAGRLPQTAGSMTCAIGRAVCRHRYSRAKCSIGNASACILTNSAGDPVDGIQGGDQPAPTPSRRRRRRRPARTTRASIVTDPVRRQRGGRARGARFNNVLLSSPALDTMINWCRSSQPRRCVGAIVGAITANNSVSCANASSMITVSNAQPLAPVFDGVSTRYSDPLTKLQMLLAVLPTTRRRAAPMGSP